MHKRTGNGEWKMSMKTHSEELSSIVSETRCITGHLKMKGGLIPFLRNVCVCEFSTGDIAKDFDRKWQQLTHVSHILSYNLDKTQPEASAPCLGRWSILSGVFM